MKKIELINGYVEFPERWVAVKNENPLESTNCGVLSVRNGLKYGIPTFLFFLKGKTVREMNKEDEKQVIQACVDIFPDFSLVLSSQVEPQGSGVIPDNMEEWDNAPTIGWFHVFDAADEQDMFTDALIYRNK